MKIITCTTPLLEQNMYIVEEGKHCIVIDPYYDEKGGMEKVIEMASIIRRQDR